jgi:hypothetical protein
MKKNLIIIVILMTTIFSCQPKSNDVLTQDTITLDSIILPPNDEIDTTAAPSNARISAVTPDFWNTTYRSNKIVNLYVEVGYDLFLKYGVNTETEIRRVFKMSSDISQSLTGVKFVIDKIKIWQLPDPYTSVNSVSSTLYSFSTNSQFEKAPFKIFVNNKNIGGQAFISRGSVTSAKYAVATLANRRATNINIFSFDVYIIIHELYHNLGLSHSQNDCAWLSKTGTRLGRLDSCVACEASTACTRSINCTGSTKRMAGDIMSYCHIYNTTQYKFHPAELAVLHKSLWNSTLPGYTP